MNNVTESQAYEAVRLAQINEHKGAMASSAKLCAQDAMSCFNVGDFAHAVARSRESLRYSVGVFHADYAKLADIVSPLAVDRPGHSLTCDGLGCFGCG